MAAKVLEAENGRCMWWCDEDGSHGFIQGFMSRMTKAEKKAAREAAEQGASAHNGRHHR